MPVHLIAKAFTTLGPKCNALKTGLKLPSHLMEAFQQLSGSKQKLAQVGF